MADYSKTLQLRESPVPMRANLPQNEPKAVAEWEKKRLYERLARKRAGAPRFVLHDGPPYANGELHMGHALNKSLKDIIVRYKSLAGYDAPYVPGWDCHGLPIEHNVMKESERSHDKAKKADAAELSSIRKKCRSYAQKYVGIQREGFKRLGCIGKWDDPYLTMDPQFESRIIEAFGELHSRGFIYRGQKPIHWCPHCRTALAASTAEAEYATHVTDAITVAFASTNDPSTSILIWTTTPWTLPANLAVAVRADLEYVTVKTGGRHFIVAESLLEKTAEEAGWSEYTTGDRVSGAQLEGRTFRHPFIDRTVPVILGDFVTTDQGTGVVHIAPGHGHDDYIAGLKYKLPILAPVDESGCFTKEATVCEGTYVFDANPEIIDLLRERGALVHSGKLEHQYPHCWRCKGPIIFRATRQWFMSIDHAGGESGSLRTSALSAADSIQWIPSWGKDRFVGSVRERPDWCLSRQRAWGVPIPALICTACDGEVIDSAVIGEAMALAKSGRLDEWFSGGAPARVCAQCGGALRREQDILDVWFDSGVSWFAADRMTGGSRDEATPLPPRAELYLEGSDQHRGWFQSSLWPSLAITGEPPYRAVLTHGFMLDGAGRAMHKSAGNAIAPSEVMAKYGADIIRLWVASENYREDLRISYPILDQVADTYRKIRNTWRFLAANIIDLPADASLPSSGRTELDRWAVSALQRYVKRCRGAYDDYAFHDVYRATLEFFTNDLSSFYLDIVKDRLYCDRVESPSRRAAQITCREILSATLRIMAPVLVFTSDVVWLLSYVAKGGDEAESVHLSDMPAVEEPDESIFSLFEPFVSARGEILKAIEAKRAAGIIKSSQMASVTTTFQGDLERLRMLCQIAEMRSGSETSVELTEKQKCPRCWRYLDLAGEHQGERVCERCADVLTK